VTLTDADIERIADRVVEKLDERKRASERTYRRPGYLTSLDRVLDADAEDRTVKGRIVEPPELFG
jgi:hypothetical protein